MPRFGKLNSIPTIMLLTGYFLGCGFLSTLRGQGLNTEAIVNGSAAGGSCLQQGTTNAACQAGWNLDWAVGAGGASATAHYGVLRALISASTSTTSLGAADTNAAAEALSTDTLSFTGLSTNAFLQATIALSGTTSSVSSTGAATGSFSVDYQLDLRNGSTGNLSSCSTAGTLETCSATLPVSPSDLVYIQQALNLSGNASVLYAIGAASVNADYTHTARVTGLVVVDASGNPVPGVTVVAASGADYNAMAAMFSAFSGVLDITQEGFQFNSRFTLGANSDGINPLSEASTLRVGTFSVVIPAGSFTKNRKGDYVYQGTINGADLQVQIASTAANTYSLKVDGQNIADLTTLSNPVTVGLEIGNDVGTAAIAAQF